ncbi:MULTISPECIES: hypothetical protein [Actinomyces]|uniref:Uncharacterized protein n=1 Tax=Actinomyces respiraculi TaxID=2744574 RepID=A0A7T0LKK6_9ACTO|nr:MULTISPECIES: hypothetical protein [Actinomyces]QPL05342.1 hypothetical protein ID810_11650 [Actinomyces respiraculi]
MGFMEQMQATEIASAHYADWMQQTGVTRMDVQVDALGARVRFQTRAFKDGVWYNNEVPAMLVREAIDLRAAMATPQGGTWTRAVVSMSAPEYRLITDVDYDAKPVLDPPVNAEDCAEELRLFPRDPDATPDWMRA